MLPKLQRRKPANPKNTGSNSLHMDAYKLLRSYDANGMLGELTGISESQQGALFSEALNLAKEKIHSARLQAQATGQDVTLDATRLSGVISGDRWTVSTSGRVKRFLDDYPEVETQLINTSAPGQPTAGKTCRDLTAIRPLLARAAYNGLWAPSGTNWQPIRTMELSGKQIADLTGSDSGAGLLVFARDRYDSVLSDVACLCGRKQDSHAESIDLGIWLAFAQQTAIAHGCPFRSILLGRITSRTKKAIEILAERTPTLDPTTRAAAQDLMASLQSGRHIPVLALVPNLPDAAPLTLPNLDPTALGGLQPSSFDDLVFARSTQRVAAPDGNLDKQILEDLWKSAQQAYPHDDLACCVYSNTDDMARQIGQAMHDGLEGPEGLLARISLSGFCDYLKTQTVNNQELQDWMVLPAGNLDAQAAQINLPADMVPEHIRSKLCLAGQYHLENGLLLDHRSRPLTILRLVKMVRMLAKSFGRNFLRFQNTHPLLGIILAPLGANAAASRQCHVQVGKRMAHMSLLARAKGLVSIIKSGPLEIAGERISDLVQQTATPKIQTQLKKGKLAPLLIFQVGLPLAPDHEVAAGQPDVHDGLMERKLDKRAVRSQLAQHYVPLVEGSV
jgi:hypothetical protein